MADFVHINRQVPEGGTVANSLLGIRRAVGVLEELEGLKNEAIGKSQGDMQSIFGTNTPTEAQILADRWGAFLAAYNDLDNAEYAKLRDLVNALVVNN